MLLVVAGSDVCSQGAAAQGARVDGHCLRENNWRQWECQQRKLTERQADSELVVTAQRPLTGRQADSQLVRPAGRQALKVLSLQTACCGMNPETFLDKSCTCVVCCGTYESGCTCDVSWGVAPLCAGSIHRRRLVSMALTWRRSCSQVTESGVFVVGTETGYVQTHTRVLCFYTCTTPAHTRVHNTHTHTCVMFLHLHTHTCVCLCVCVCARARRASHT